MSSPEKGYREKGFGIVLNGWEPEETFAVRALVFEYSNDRHQELLAGPDEIYIQIIFGNLRKSPASHLTDYLKGLTDLLIEKGYAHVGVLLEEMQVV